MENIEEHNSARAHRRHICLTKLLRPREHFDEQRDGRREVSMWTSLSIPEFPQGRSELKNHRSGRQEIRKYCPLSKFLRNLHFSLLMWRFSRNRSIFGMATKYKLESHSARWASTNASLVIHFSSVAQFGPQGGWFEIPMDFEFPGFPTRHV